MSRQFADAVRAITAVSPMEPGVTALIAEGRARLAAARLHPLIALDLRTVVTAQISTDIGGIENASLIVWALHNLPRLLALADARVHRHRITDVDELASLPIGAVVLDPLDFAWQLQRAAAGPMWIRARRQSYEHSSDRALLDRYGFVTHIRLPR